MNTTALAKSLIKTMEKYKHQLDRIPEEKFQQNPLENEWSYSEVYHHVFDVSILSLGAIHSMLAGEGGTGEISRRGKMVLFLGFFPPVGKLKAPARIAERLKKVTRQEAKDLISEFESELGKIMPLLPGMDKNIKFKHPRLGFLNAPQWIRFTEIHLKHHLKQIKRINKAVPY